MYIPIAGPKPKFTVCVPIQIPEGDIPRIRKWINQVNQVPDHGESADCSDNPVAVYQRRVKQVNQFYLTLEVNWDGWISLPDRQ